MFAKKNFKKNYNKKIFILSSNLKMHLSLFRKKLTLIFGLFVIFSSFSQANETKLKKMSFSELIHKMTRKDDSVFTLKNTLITFNEKENERYDHSQYRLYHKPYPTDTVQVYKKINFENVHFETYHSIHNYAFINFSFHKSFTIHDSYNISFFNCEFKDQFTYTNYKPVKETKNSTFVHHCSFYSKVVSANTLNKQYIDFSFCTFDYTGSGDYSNVWDNSFLLFDIFTSEGNFNFFKNRILNDNISFAIQISDLDQVFFDENLIKSKYWNILLIHDIKNISFIKNDIDADLIYKIDKLKPEYNIQWPITKKRIFPMDYIYYNRDKDIDANNKTFDSIYNTQKVKDELLYKSNLMLLSKYHSYFKGLHDRQSANKIYVQIKNMETQRLKYLYDKDKTFDNYFELIVNRFLKNISNYGTSPSKIVLISFKIILFFAFLFLFSKNSWNIIKQNSLREKINQSIAYFTSENSLKNIQNIRQNRILKIQILRNRKNIPKTFSFLSLALIKLKIKLLNFKFYLKNYPDLTKKSWKDLSPFKKFTYNSLFLGSVIAYLSLIFFTILLNALTLSINSFTTLGFGEIPIKGFGRYLAILEGFIGWIFLTLFSVTLISQILS